MIAEWYAYSEPDLASLICLFVNTCSMINSEQVMKTYRTAAQWLELLQQRSNFKGTNIEFCQHHNVAIIPFREKM